MKKYCFLACAMIIALASCTKEAYPSIDSVNDEPVVLSFRSERPQLETGTKTAWDTESSSIIWSEGDKIRVGYTLDGDWMAQAAEGDAKFYQSDGVSIDKSNSSVGTFKVPVPEVHLLILKQMGNTYSMRFIRHLC